MKKILIVEDNKEILYTNRTMLELHGYEILSAEKLSSAENILKENKSISLIILDIMLPDGNGLDWCKKIREESNVKILFLSALDTKKDIVEGFRSGGDDYLEKPYYMEELLARVDALLRRENSEVNKTNFGNITFHDYSLSADVNGEDLRLRQKEFSLLRFLCDNSGKHFTAKEIYKAVWGVDVKEQAELQPFYNIMSGLREKLEITNVEISHIKHVGYAAVIKEINNE